MVLFIEIAPFFEGANIIQLQRCMKLKAESFFKKTEVKKLVIVL